MTLPLRFVVIVVAASVAESLRCHSGWSNSVREIPPSRINDGYCDCPIDGADEVETGACSGSMEGGWAGVQLTGSEPPGSSSKLQCPQQQSLILPLSRIGDGICDCCDGADEPPSSECADMCDEVLAAERAARRKAEADFAAGSNRRKEEMEEFAKMVEETTAEIDTLAKTGIPQYEEEVNSFDGQIRESKLKYIADRFDAVKEVQNSLGFLGTVASLEEIVSFIIASCQFAGEMANSDGSGNRAANLKTCIPLRLAGLDAGIMWENENFSEYSASVRRLDESDENSMVEFATLLDKNSGSDGKFSFGKDDSTSHHTHRPERKHHHRHHDIDDEEHEDDDEYPYEADDDYPHDYPGHDEEEEHDIVQQEAEEKTDEQPVSETPESEASEDETVEKSREQLVREAVQLSAVLTLRAAFKSRAKELMGKIDSARKRDAAEDNPEQDNDAQDEGSSEETAEYVDESHPVDPMAIQMVSGSLSRRLRQLERGEDFATSAKILLDALLLGEDADGKKRDLTNLAIGTVYHGKLSAADVSELFYALIPEFQEGNGDSDETCGSSYSSMCPPKTILREDISLPPSDLVTAAEALCEERSTTSMSCVGGESGASDEGIPTNIPDGYYGYYPPKTRGSEDTLNVHFAPLDNLEPSRMKTSHLEEQKADRERQLDEARSNLKDLEDRIGGRDGQKFGMDGELYGIRDSCHKVESGKYEYELCIFGKATQREKGQKGGGTNLGRWTGMKTDESTGERVMTWEKGTKCWNGPQRSATVTVTCGAETKVLTADEPRTCEYEMKMESHIACDDKFGEFVRGL